MRSFEFITDSNISFYDTRKILSFDQMMDLCNKTENFDYTDEIAFNTITRTFNYRLNIPESFLHTGARNFRGSVYDLKTKELLALPFHKFFNINENQFTDEKTVRRWSISSIYEKVDGTLIYLYLIDDHLVCRTKRRFDSEYTTKAMNIIKKTKGLEDYIRYWIKRRYTPMFELVSILSRQVVYYDFETLCFLALRNMDNGEIIYAGPDIMPYNTDEIISVWPINDQFSSVDEIVQKCRNSSFERKDVLEGYTVLFTNGEIVKIKTPQYVELAKLRDAIKSDLAIVKMLFCEQLDDFMAEFKDNSEVLSFVNSIISSVNDTWNKRLKRTKQFWDDNKELERKDYALKAKSLLTDANDFSLVMQYYKESGNIVNLNNFIDGYLKRREWRESSFFKSDIVELCD